MRKRLVLAAAMMCFSAGCISSTPSRPAATRPATDIDPVQATAAYWLDQPAIVSVRAPNFDVLWTAADNAMREDFFLPDRHDYRGGVLTSVPLVASQPLEFWKHDTVTGDDSAKAAMATFRRTIRYDFTKEADGQFRVAPKVLVERYVLRERRITAVVDYNGAFAAGPAEGDAQTDQGITITPEYWYAVGRDARLERILAVKIDRLLSKSAGRADISRDTDSASAPAQ